MATAKQRGGSEDGVKDKPKAAAKKRPSGAKATARAKAPAARKAAAKPAAVKKPRVSRKPAAAKATRVARKAPAAKNASVTKKAPATKRAAASKSAPKTAAAARARVAKKAPVTTATAPVVGASKQPRPAREPAVLKTAKAKSNVAAKAKARPLAPPPHKTLSEVVAGWYADIAVAEAATLGPKPAGRKPPLVAPLPDRPVTPIDVAANVAAKAVLGHAHDQSPSARATPQSAKGKHETPLLRELRGAVVKPVSQQLSGLFANEPDKDQHRQGGSDPLGRRQGPGGPSNKPHVGHYGVPRRAAG